jgi:hypothetical protein
MLFGFHHAGNQACPNLKGRNHLVAKTAKGKFPITSWKAECVYSGYDCIKAVDIHTIYINSMSLNVCLHNSPSKYLPFLCKTKVVDMMNVKSVGKFLQKLKGRIMLGPIKTEMLTKTEQLKKDYKKFISAKPEKSPKQIANDRIVNNILKLYMEELRPHVEKMVAKATSLEDFDIQEIKEAPRETLATKVFKKIREYARVPPPETYVSRLDVKKPEKIILDPPMRVSMPTDPAAIFCLKFYDHTVSSRRPCAEYLDTLNAVTGLGLGPGNIEEYRRLIDKHINWTMFVIQYKDKLESLSVLMGLTNWIEKLLDNQEYERMRVVECAIGVVQSRRAMERQYIAQKDLTVGKEKGFWNKAKKIIVGREKYGPNMETILNWENSTEKVLDQDLGKWFYASNPTVNPFSSIGEPGRPGVDFNPEENPKKKMIEQFYVCD